MRKALATAAAAPLATSGCCEAASSQKPPSGESRDSKGAAGRGRSGAVSGGAWAGRVAMRSVKRWRIDAVARGGRRGSTARSWNREEEGSG